MDKLKITKPQQIPLQTSDQHKPFYRTKVFYFWNIAIMLFVGFIFISYLLSNDYYYDSCFSKTCFEFAFQEFQIPLKVLALLIPINGFIGLIHRSKQYSDNLRISHESVRITNYFKHKEEFTNWFQEWIKPSTNMYDINSDIIYNQFFKNSIDGDLNFSINQATITILKKELKAYIDQFNNSKSPTKKLIENISFIRIAADPIFKLDLIKSNNSTHYYLRSFYVQLLVIHKTFDFLQYHNIDPELNKVISKVIKNLNIISMFMNNNPLSTKEHITNDRHLINCISNLRESNPIV